MNPQLKLAILGLRWILGLVILFESAYFALSPAAAAHFAKAGFPVWLRPVLGGSEAIAALLLLLPVTSLVGGYALLVILAVAVGIHFLHGQFNVGSLIVYAAAAIVCIVQRNGEAAKGTA
jgi:DoxX-like family